MNINQKRIKKNVKEKLKKTGKDFISDFKEVVEAAKRAFKGEMLAQSSSTTATC